MKCGHCNADDSLDQIVQHALEEGERELQPGFSITWGKYVSVMRCSNCKGLILRTYSYGDHMDVDDIEFEVLYPQQPDHSAVPERIHVEYKRAQKVKNVDAGYYLIGLRRTLEAICVENGIDKGLLWKKLEQLATIRQLPQVFADMAAHLKDLGNIGAHDFDINVGASDATVASDFIVAILEYLYIAPAKLDRVKKELARRRDGGSKQSS